ncbi:MAG: RNA pseudouridine synthase [Puniceicoccales bacterium]|jgi:23S rRNA pseudouridine955/2504/2580 synthase|nr:RNA pseudouridine synthase [Puniceicoccales bacterium]
MVDSSSPGRIADIWSSFLHKKAVIVVPDENGLIAVNKPAGVISHPNFGDEGCNSLIRASYDLRRRAYLVNGGEIFLLNRLDAPTEGLVLLTSSEQVALAVRKCFQQCSIRKIYYAFTKCGPVPSSPWHDCADERSNGKSVHLHHGSGTELRTKAKVIEKIQWENLSCFLLKLQPLTGRTHQLRFQCSRHGVHIAGDRIYGDFGYNKAFHATTRSHKLQLLAAEIEIDYTLKDKVFHFSARTPSLDGFLSLPGCGKRSTDLS